MRIMILANNDVGLYQFRKELIEELLKENEVMISLPYGDLVDPLRQLGCKFIDTPVDRRGKNPITDVALFRRYRSFLKKEKPDLVITYTIKPNVYGGIACRLARVPYAVNITGLGTAFEKNGLLKCMAVIMNRVACKNAKVVFFENEANRQLFINERIVKKEQTHRLNGAGVNLEKYQVSTYPEGKKIKFLFMGRVMAEKGIDELFAAMSKLVADNISCELDVIGGCEEDYKEKIDKFEREGWLHYYGYQKDVRPFIEDCHCFVLPSWHEGMANTNLESAASGRPVITSDIPGCKEAVVENVSGFLVKKRNENSLYEAMKRFLTLTYDEKRMMGLYGRKHMEKKFDKRQVVQNTITALKSF